MEEFKNLQVAEFSFRMLSFCGIWRPITLTSLWPIRIYNLYSCMVFALEYYFILTLFINLCRNKHNLQAFIETIFIFLTASLLSFKGTYIKICQQDIISLINMFLQENSCPHSKEEVAIYKKIKKDERFNERLFVISILCTATLYLFLPLTDRRNISLPFKQWIPYDLNSKTIFYITYISQIIFMYWNAFVYATTDSLLIIVILQISYQLEILRNRLFEIPNVRGKNSIQIVVYQEECNLIKYCVDHHVSIFSMGKKLNDIFGFFISLQFFVSILNLCTSGYYLTNVNISGADFWSSVMIVFSFMIQIFVYCWFGEEMTRKSLSIADEIYKMDWNSLSVQTKQKLLIIMMRANRPMQLTGTSIIILSTETFLKVLKASYSSYNLLRNSN